MEKKHVTPNGSTVFFHKNNRLHSFCLCLYVKAGSMYEEKGKNGISHFFEHIVFRNIHFHRDQKLYQTLDRLGLTFNATTYNELIRFSICGAPQHFKEAADILAQIFEPIDISEEEIDLERMRVLAEIREEKEDDCVAYLGRKVSWKGTSLSRSITGKKKILKEIRKEDLRKFQEDILYHGACFFYVTGCLPDDAEEALTEAIERYPLVSTFSENWDNMAPVPESFFQRKAKIHIKKGDETEVFFGFDLDITRYSMAEMDLLYDMLFRGDYCRMYQELSEKKGYVYSYDPGSEQYANIGQIKFMYEVQPKHLLASIETVIGIFRELKRDIGDALDYVKPNYIDNAYAILDNPDDFNWMQAYEDKILKNPYKDMEDRIHAYHNVTKERMTQICQEIFCLSNLVIAVAGEKKKIPEEEILQVIETL
ncbi:MAG: pitrilysin family protein [Eubacteriales bacterium]|nr:pitrilysin family protein [Eubacteriales bacterium]